MERLQKFMARCGVASRRHSEELIERGLVRVNGQVATLGQSIDPEKDLVEYAGQRLQAGERTVTVLVNKPAGYVCTAQAQDERPTVCELVADLGLRLYPVGRLDCETEGLIFLSNDGDLTYALTHPKHRVEKVYKALLEGEVSSAELAKLERGVVLDDGYKTARARARLLGKSGKNTRIELTIHEGKNRQVRRMAEAIGHPVLKLKRVSEGGIELGSVEEGKYRVLTDAEVKRLKEL